MIDTTPDNPFEPVGPAMGRRRDKGFAGGGYLEVGDAPSLSQRAPRAEGEIMHLSKETDLKA
jgi:hypothetical protein